MIFSTASTIARPVRLKASTRKWAFDSLHGQYGDEAMQNPGILLDDIENELGIATCPINWPIGSGKEFKGVYDRASKKVEIFSDTKKGTRANL